MASSDLARSTSISSHRRKAVPADAGSAGQVSGEIERIERRLSLKHDKSGDINSWISDQSQNLQNPNLPLTPPALSADSGSNRSSAVEPEQEQGLTTPETTIRQGPATPSPLRSPPTPDHTPPKPPPALRPGSPESRKFSSTAASFITAHEQHSVDYLAESDADASFHTPETYGHSEKARGKNAVGLGLRLNTPDGGKTPTMHSPRIVGETTLAEPWADGGTGIEPDPLTAPESMAVQEVEQERRLGKELLHPIETTPLPAPEDFQAAFERDSPTPPRTPPDPLISVSPAEQVSPPASNDSDLIHVDKKRLSGISNQSQIVNAVVLSTPKKRRQQLRHCSKNESLRSVSSPIPTSNRSSLTSSDSRPRPLHRSPKMSEIPNRFSLNSDSGISMGSDTRIKVDDSIGPSDIPGLRSSLRRSSEKERALARKYSDLARRKSAMRPSTAPDGDKGTPSSRSARPRSHSTANAKYLGPDYRGRRTADYPPVVPPRSSSLSAPTSHNNSRATSLTSTSLHKHNAQQSQQYQQPNQHLAPRSSPRTQNARLAAPEIRVGPAPLQDREETPSKEDIVEIPRRSLMTTTPFSGVSLPTSTPGPVEVDEATTVNIYPHSNTSVLVVQQFSRNGSANPRLLASRSGNVSITLDNGPGRARPIIASHDVVASDFHQRPYEPVGPPPAVMLIPPTPFQAVDQPVSRSQSRKYPPVSSRFSVMRRALTTRRYSESLIAPIARPLVVQRDSAQASGSMPKLSPLWRPKAFWSDVPGAESDVEELHQDAYIRNTLGLPQVRLKAGPGSLSRRIGSLRRRKQQQAAEVAREEGLAGAERRVGILARMKNTTITPFASLAEAIEKLRARRSESHAERQRDHLRKHIGPPVLIADASHNL